MHEPRNLDHLLAQVTKLHGNRGHQAFSQLGLHHGQFPALLLLMERDGCTHSDLAERLHVSAPTVSKTVQRMESSGFVVRTSDPNDERVSRVYVTDAGREIYQSTQLIMDDLQADLESVLAPEEQAELYRILLKLRDHFLKQLEP